MPICFLSVLVPDYSATGHNIVSSSVPTYYSQSDFARFPNKNNHKVGALLNPAVIHGNQFELCIYTF